MRRMSHDIWSQYLSINENLPIEFTHESMKGIIQIHLSKIPRSCRDILDIGAGDGYAAEMLTSMGKNVIAVSINPKEVSYMVKRGIAAQREDMHNLSFAPESFDCVYMRQVLEHSIAPYLVFSEVFRVLRDGGFWMLIVPPELDIAISDGGYLYAHNSAVKHYSVLTEIQLKTLWEKTGFVLVTRWILGTPNGTDLAYLLRKGDRNES